MVKMAKSSNKSPPPPSQQITPPHPARASKGMHSYRVRLRRLNVDSMRNRRNSPHARQRMHTTSCARNTSRKNARTSHLKCTRAHTRMRSPAVDVRIGWRARLSRRCRRRRGEQGGGTRGSARFRRVSSLLGVPCLFVPCSLVLLSCRRLFRSRGLIAC